VDELTAVLLEYRSAILGYVSQRDTREHKGREPLIGSAQLEDLV
jgi:hypothetical protein